MSGYHGMTPALAPCKHGRSRWVRCQDCVDERAARDAAEEARMNEAARPYLDMIANHRQWFDVCAFCPRDALVVRTRHATDCPYNAAMYEAASRYAVHVVNALDPVTADWLSPPSGEVKP